jgi:hypothetical protein
MGGKNLLLADMCNLLLLVSKSPFGRASPKTVSPVKLKPVKQNDFTLQYYHSVLHKNR